MNDSQGIPIRVGQLVAFNRSGNVVPGTVVGVSPRHVKIRATCRGSEWNISKVRNGPSILVLP